jgi:hypothetical protein
LLDIATTALKGLAPATVDTDSAKYLSADGTYTAPTGGSGDVTGPGTHGDDLLWKSAGTDTNTLQVTGISIADTTNHITGAGNFNGVTVEDHSALHENTGADEINVGGLSGLLADGQTPLGHAYSVHTDTVPSTDFADDTIAPSRIETQSDSGSLIFNASGVPAYLGPGSDGDVLTSGGTGVIPAWTAPTGGAATDLATDGTDVAVNSTAPGAANYILKSTSTTVATWQLDTSGILTGAVDPTTEGVEGNFYYNTVKQGFWYKDSGGWEEVGVVADDVTIEVDETNGLQIIDDGVTYAKIQNVVADDVVLGRISGADGVIEELTGANILTISGADAAGTNRPADEISTSGTNVTIDQTAPAGSGLTLVSTSSTGAAWKPRMVQHRALTIESPTNTEDFSFFFTIRAITIARVAVAVRGATPSITGTLVHSTDRSDVSPTVIHTFSAVTSEAGTDGAASGDATIPLDSYVWFESTAVGAATDELFISMAFVED